MATTIPKEELRALFVTMSGLPAPSVIWDGEPKGPVVPAQGARRLILNVVARRKVGRDTRARTYPDANTIVTTYTGQRVVTISVKAENMGEEEGFDLLEEIRSKLEDESSGAALNAVQMSLNEALDVRTFDGSAGNRKISVAQIDVLFNQATKRVVTSVASGTNPSYIESAELEGKADEDLEGVEVDVP